MWLFGACVRCMYTVIKMTYIDINYINNISCVPYTTEYSPTNYSVTIIIRLRNSSCSRFEVIALTCVAGDTRIFLFTLRCTTMSKKNSAQ